MKCKVDGCDREAMYKKKQVCQKHYFRFMRNGTYEKSISRRYRYRTSNGYEKIYEPNHELSCSDGYVYEHRFVLFNKYGRTISKCEICKTPWAWSDIYNSHVDHVDNDKSNNDVKNLRPLCNSCNVSRSNRIFHERESCTSIEFDGETKTAEEWSRSDICSVTGKTIINRISKGMSVSDAITMPSKTIKKTS